MVYSNIIGEGVLSFQNLCIILLQKDHALLYVQIKNIILNHLDHICFNNSKDILRVWWNITNMTGVMKKGPLTSDVTIFRKRRQSSWTWNVKIAATSTRKYFCRLRLFNNMGKRTLFSPSINTINYPPLGCSRFAANLQQICCRQICSQERRIYVRRCLQLAAIFLWTSQLFAAYLLQTYVCRKTAENHASYSSNKKIFAGGLLETLNNSKMFTVNLRELSTIKIVCRKLAEILNKHIFNLMNHFNEV